MDLCAVYRSNRLKKITVVSNHLEEFIAAFYWIQVLFKDQLRSGTNAALDSDYLATSNHLLLPLGSGKNATCCSNPHPKSRPSPKSRLGPKPKICQSGWRLW